MNANEREFRIRSSPRETFASIRGFRVRRFLLAAGLIQPPFLQVDLVEAEVMAQFVKEGRADLFSVNGLVFVRRVPDVFEEQDDLGRKRNAARLGVGIGFSNEQAEGVRLDAVTLQWFGGTTLKRDWKSLGRDPKIARKFRQDPLNLRFRDREQCGPITGHENTAKAAGLS